MSSLPSKPIHAELDVTTGQVNPFFMQPKQTSLCGCVCDVEACVALSPHIQTEIANHTHSHCHTLPSLELKVYLQGRDAIKAAAAFAKQTAVTVDPRTDLDVVPIVPSDMDPNHAGVSHFEPLFKGPLVQPWTPSAFMESMVPMDSTR